MRHTLFSGSTIFACTAIIALAKPLTAVLSIAMIFLCSPEGVHSMDTLFAGIEPDNAGTRVSKFKDYGCIVTDKPQSAIPDDDPRRAIVGNVHDVIRSCCSFL